MIEMTAEGKTTSSSSIAGYDFIKEKVKSLNLLQAEPGEDKLIAELGKCLNCGVCLPSCPVLEATSFDVFLGPRSMATTLSRVNPDFWNVKDLVYSCSECGACEEICPEKVPVPEIVSAIRAKIFKLRPEIIPESHKVMHKNLSRYGTSLVPEDEQLRIDLAESAVKDLGLPYKRDIYKESADVVYFAGCISTHRSLEIRESGKLTLEKLGTDYTLMKNEACCGLPATLIGDVELASKLAASTFERVKQVGAKTVVATCAGCANTLQNSFTKLESNSGIRVKHLTEYLVEDVGLDKVMKLAKAKQGKKKETIERVAIHPACHLTRHLSRRIQDYIIEVAKTLPGVEVTTRNIRQQCCGAGGLLSTYKPNVASKITSARLKEILQQGKNPQRIVAPCPTCVIRLSEEVSNSSLMTKVEDLTVLLAKKIV